MSERDREREVARLEAEIRELQAKVRRLEREADERQVSLREELEPQMREVVGFARKRGHTWLDMEYFYGPPRATYDDEKLVELLVELFSVREVRRVADDHGGIEREIRTKRKELKKEKESLANLREMFGHPTD
jgi:hypothetical protein